MLIIISCSFKAHRKKEVIDHRLYIAFPGSFKKNKSAGDDIAFTMHRMLKLYIQLFPPPKFESPAG